MKAVFVLLVLATLSIPALAGGDPKYPVTDIPDSLRTGVSVVVRLDETIFEIIAQNKATVRTHYVVTIFNEKGKRFAKHAFDYDKLTRISQLSASVYDAGGKLIRKLKNNDINDQSAYDGYTLYSDNRIKSFDLTQGTYPYTVEVEMEKEYNFLFHIDHSYVYPGENAAVQNFRYQLIYPTALRPRAKMQNGNTKPQLASVGENKESMTWTLANLKPIKIEPFSKDEIPAVIAAPVDFEFDSYKGSMKDWNEFGKWIVSLNSGRNILPDATKENLRQLTQKAKTREEKVKLVYEYLQSKTRYVSIQLGIGGYQPFEAAVVDKVGYGDCKALSNYTIAMLDAVGVKANYALIYAGPSYDDLDESFPSSQFNHAIVAVPNDQDTLWLECTSQTNPFGYQGRFTGDRKALLITENGGKIVNTIKYSAEDNLQSRKAEVYLDMLGNAKAKVRTFYSGTQYENDDLDYYLNSGTEDQKKWVQNNTDIPVFDINSFSMKNNKGKIPSAEVQIDLSLSRLASVNGKRLFVTPNLMNRNTVIPEKMTSRKSDIMRRTTYLDIDTVHFNLPEGIYPEALPQEVKISNRFGEYEAKFIPNNGSLLYIRRMKVNKGVFPASSYQEMVDFYKNVTKADNTKVVFLNKT